MRLHRHASTGDDPPAQGRVALVTGVGRRIAIGAAITRRLAGDGAAVVVHSWVPHDAEQPWGADAAGPEAVVAEIRSARGRAEHVSADLADPDAPARVVAAARRAFGHVDVVVANHARSAAQNLEQLTADELDRCHAVNTRGSLLLAQAFAAQHDGAARRRASCSSPPASTTARCPTSCPTSRRRCAAPAHRQRGRAPSCPAASRSTAVNPGPNDTGYADDTLRRPSPPPTPDGAGAHRPTLHGWWRGW